MLIGDKETVRQVVSWWRGLQPSPETKQPGDRTALARLRRCTSVTEALFEQETQVLVRKCGARWDSELSRLALAASVLAHVRADKVGISMARQIGPVDTSDDATALCKPVRFRRVLDAETYDECLRVFRRLVVLAGGALDVTDLARSVMMWPREDALDGLVGDQIRRKWVYDYWNAGAPDAAFDKKIDLERNIGMSRFLQLHLLTFYPPSNVNRDDTGNPKTATVGGVTRLRISSQALKRAWRTSDIFDSALTGHMGQRTQRLGEDVLVHLREKGVEEKKAVTIAREIAGVYGKVKGEKDANPTRTEQLVFISPTERDAAFAVADRLASGEKIDLKKEQDTLLHRADSAADIALFGRMLASAPTFNREAAVQVAHAITTHRVTVEDDYYTAIDDLKRDEEDTGAGFLGEAGFGSGVFYLYLCINRDLLKKNLGDESQTGVAEAALGALVEAAMTVSPSGKQNSFAALARAGYVLVEKGNAQPRTLAGAFARPVGGADLMEQSIKALKEFRSELTRVYGASADETCELALGDKKSATLADIVAFCRS